MSGSDVSELTLEADWRMGRHWRAGLTGRYDFASSRTSRARLDLGWQNECLRVDLSLSRRFSASSSVDPQTRVGVDVALIGFGATPESPARTRTCPG